MALGCGLLACEDQDAPPPSPTMSQAAAPAEKTGTDLASLEQMVNLPRRPASTQWRKALRGRGRGLGPTDWKLLAVLEYPEAEAQALLGTLKPTGLAAPQLDDGGWLPEATRQALKGARPYDASAFYRPPLQNGVVLHVPGTSTFVLSLYTM